MLKINCFLQFQKAFTGYKLNITMKNIEKYSQSIVQLLTFAVVVAFFLPITAYAQSASQEGGLVSFLLPAVLMIGVFWFFLIRPQQKRQKSHQQMLNSISNGAKIVTNGGIHGVVKKLVSGEILEVEISKGVIVKLNRQMISTVVDYKATSTKNTGSSKKSPVENKKSITGKRKV